MKIPKQANTTEFKELAVKRVKDGQSISSVIKELGLGAGQSGCGHRRTARSADRGALLPVKTLRKFFPPKTGGHASVCTA